MQLQTLLDFYIDHLILNRGMRTPSAVSERRPVQFQRWIKILGEEAPALERELSGAVSARVEKGEYAVRDIEYISALKRPLATQTLKLSPDRLEKLRRLCQLWDIELKATHIESHRKILGPLIVAVKKMLLPILRVLLKDMIRQQRDFNAAAIRLLAELSDGGLKPAIAPAPHPD